MDKEVKVVIGSVLAVLVLVVGLVVVLTKLEHVPPGHVGISVKKCDQGGVSKDPIPTGYYWRELFCEEVIEYPTNMQNLILTKSADEGRPVDESITVTSSEGLSINLDVAMNFTLDPAKVPAIYTKWRTDITDISHKFLRQTVREMLQAAFAKYTAEELYSTKKEIARVEVEKALVERMKTEGFLVMQFTINRLDPPTQVVEAINRKVAMIQDAQRSEQEVRKKQAEASQAVAEAEGKARAAEAQAKGDAAAITMRAEAQAKANNLLSKSLTPAIIQYEQARRWNGVLPQVSGNVVPMLNLDKP